MQSEPITVKDAEFQGSVLDSSRPVLVDFWAPWCGPCKMVGPILEDLAQEYDQSLVIAKVNTDEDQEQAFKYGVRGIPTMILFKDGAEIDRLVGALPKDSLKAWIDARVEG